MSPSLQAAHVVAHAAVNALCLVVLAALALSLLAALAGRR